MLSIIYTVRDRNMIYTIIAKPTKECNADCAYCSSPPDDESAWTVDTFEKIWNNLKANLAPNVTWIWHGGEPMLLSPDFYRSCLEIAKRDKPHVEFGMQSNLLLYKKSRWENVFNDVFDGRISTSFDPDEKFRTIKGSTEKYTKQFYKKIDEVISDNFKPLVIGTYSEESIPYADSIYELSKSRGEKSFHLRFNYRYPAGRASEDGAVIMPKSYGEMLISLYNKWIVDLPNFRITPLDQMLRQVVDETQRSQQCPWTNDCGGQFLGILPNGDLYNCGEISDLDDTTLRYGNAIEGWISSTPNSGNISIVEYANPDDFPYTIMKTNAARKMKRRVVEHPTDCKTCRHYTACRGGCMRDAELYGRGLGGKFFYCQSWKMVFDRIKESIMTGEAEGMLERFGYQLRDSQMIVSDNLYDRDSI